METIDTFKLVNVVKSYGGVADIRQLINALRVGREGAIAVLEAAEGLDNISVRRGDRRSGTPAPEGLGVTFCEELRFVFVK